MALSFVSSPIAHLFYYFQFSLHRQRFLFNQLRSRLIYWLLSLNTTSLHIEGFYHLVNTMISIELIIRTVALRKPTSEQKKVFCVSITAFISLLPKMLKNNILHNLMSGSFSKKLTTWIIHSSVARIHLPIYVYWRR